jgi:hypothetical protein
MGERRDLPRSNPASARSDVERKLSRKKVVFETT